MEHQSLTRRVLTEKSSPFWKYNFPLEVPEHIWNKVRDSMLKISDTVVESQRADKIIEYLAYEILSPLMHEKDFTISEVEMLYLSLSDSKRKIIFNHYYFNMPFSTLNTMVSDFSTGEFLRDIIDIFWRNKHKTS